MDRRINPVIEMEYLHQCISVPSLPVSHRVTVSVSQKFRRGLVQIYRGDIETSYEFDLTGAVDKSSPLSLSLPLSSIDHSPINDRCEVFECFPSPL